ncbi:MAG: hypothetical protein ABIK60_02500, partial [candidate division WOR-3 bacterium]
YFSTGTGNFMCENIRYVVYQCDECQGEGKLEMSLSEMIDYLFQNYWGKDTFREFRKFVKENIIKKEGNVYYVRCQSCNGAGEWEEWY